MFYFWGVVLDKSHLAFR